MLSKELPRSSGFSDSFDADIHGSTRAAHAHRRGRSPSRGRNSGAKMSTDVVAAPVVGEPATLSELLLKFESRTARVGIIGLGYVGLPLVLLFEEAGFPTVGFDVDEAKTVALNRGESYIRHIGAERIKRAFRADGARATTNFGQLASCDAIIICVPTPLGIHREPDLKYVRMTAETITKTLRPGQLVVLESTTYPGTTR